MDKLSAEQEMEILSEVPRVITSLVTERDLYKHAYLEQATRNQVEKLAGDMIQKGLRAGSVQEVADDLQKQAQEGAIDLRVMQQAVELSAPDMGKHAHVSDELSGSAGSSDLERFVLGG